MVKPVEPAAQSTACSIAVVMLTLNQRDTTLRALGSFTAEERKGARFVLWDNGSTDGTADAVRAQFPDVHVHWSERNLGVASGRNAGARLAIERFRPTHLLFLDNDLVMTPGFIAALADAFRKDARVGQAQAKLRSLQQPDRLNDGGGCRIDFWRGTTRPVGFDEVDRGQFDTPKPCVACGGAMMVRADVFLALGGFDTAFDPFGPEDIDFSLRLQARGYTAMYVPAAMAYHQVSHTFEGGGTYTAKYARLKAQHWLRFLGRHGSVSQKVGFACLGVPLIAARMTIRELRKGNPGAVLGSALGVFASLRRSSRRTSRAGKNSRVTGV
jgi:GT2 family glycosyltransferase